jgi:hypothetical protein
MAASSYAAAQSVDVTPHFNHDWDSARNHCLNRSSVSKERSGIPQSNPAFCHVIGEEEMQTFEDADHS